MFEAKARTQAVLCRLDDCSLSEGSQKLQLNLPDPIRDCLKGVGERGKRRVELVHVQVFFEDVYGSRGQEL